MSDHGSSVALVVGAKMERPVRAVDWTQPLPVPGDSGFTVVFSDGDPHRFDDGNIITVCLHCLIERYPEIGAAMDAARANPEVLQVVAR